MVGVRCCVYVTVIDVMLDVMDMYECSLCTPLRVGPNDICPSSSSSIPPPFVKTRNMTDVHSHTVSNGHDCEK
jgi:hypothetical protein